MVRLSNHSKEGGIDCGVQPVQVGHQLGDGEWFLAVAVEVQPNSSTRIFSQLDREQGTIGHHQLRDDAYLRLNGSNLTYRREI